MPEPSGPTLHVANEGAWRAICLLPDFCKVGSVIVPFDSFAIIDNETLSSPDVETQGVPVYRVGDMHRGVLADAGDGVPSGTSLAGGYVKFLSGQDNVLINGLPVVRHDSACVINCNAAGLGGTLGRLLTELAASLPLPEAPSPELQALLDAEADDRSWWTKTTDFLSGAWDSTKRVAEASWNDPGDTGIGLLKGIGNLPSDLWNLGVMVAKPTMMADYLNHAALDAYKAGDVAQANKLAAKAHEINSAGYVGDIFEIKSDAQRGGSFLSMFIPVGAVVKGVGTASKVARGANAADTVADGVKTADAISDAARTAKAADGVGDGVKAADEVSDGVRAADEAGDAGNPGVHVGPLSALPATTEASVVDKLQRYLLNAAHPVGGSKAKWFSEALGFTQDNAGALAAQIKFDPTKAVATGLTEHGQKLNQTIPIVGANGKTIDVLFAWIRNNDGIVRLVSAIPSKK